ncbi:MAG TPA: hypothetical protein VHM72_05305 [Solirubrobacteraceae bacterium]|nr:hypothetical protein [Solirubrobacteraceae bacterium]
MAALAATLAAVSASAHVKRDGLGHGVIPAAAGVVTATPGTGATSFTIELRGGTTETVDVSGSTTYLEHGTSSASLSDLQKGDLVAVFGTTSAGSVAATEVVIAVPRGTSTPALATVGVVQGAPSVGSFTITTRGGVTETVDVGATTTYYERWLPGASLTDVTSGELVAVFGSTSGTTVTASTVVIHHGFRRGFAIAGTVEGTPGPTATSFTIQTRGGGTETVDVTGSTLYFERGTGQVTLASVASGDIVGVFGVPSSSSTVTALAVIVASPPSSTGTFATAGTVQTVPSGGDFVIETCNHTQVTVDTNSATTFVERGVSGLSIDAVKPGEDVAVFGSLSGQTVTATQVVIGGNERAHPGHFVAGAGQQGAGQPSAPGGYSHHHARRWQ